MASEPTCCDGCQWKDECCFPRMKQPIHICDSFKSILQGEGDGTTE